MVKGIIHRSTWYMYILKSIFQAKVFGQSFMMSRLNVAVDDVANAEAEKKAQ